MDENIEVEQSTSSKTSLEKEKIKLSSDKTCINRKQWHQKKFNKKGKEAKNHSKKWHSYKKGKRSHNVKVPVLRPVGAQVPRAPLNSTQFIMDDHENSALFLHFQSQEMLKNIEYQGDSCDGSSPFQPTDWLPYNMADFEWAYQTAKEDRMMNASMSDIRKAILSLEAKISVVAQLLEASPSRILARLQEQLLKLQEENGTLQQKRLHYEHCKKSSSSSSSSTTSSSSTSSSSDSSSSSSGESDSECSNPECETCLLKENNMEFEEEKENTCPETSQSSPDLHEVEHVSDTLVE